MTDFFSLLHCVLFLLEKKNLRATRRNSKKKKKSWTALVRIFFIFPTHFTCVFSLFAEKKWGEDIRSAVKSALFRCPAFNDLLLYLFLSVLFVYSFFFLSLRIAEQATNTNEKSKNIFRNTLTASTRRSKKPWRKQERRVPNRGCCEFQQ